MTLLSLRYGFHLSQVTHTSELSLLSFLVCLTDRSDLARSAEKNVQLQVMIYCEVCQKGKRASANNNNIRG